MTPPRTALAPKRTALEPQRQPGKLRVAELLRSGAEVIAERGFEAATMAEIAARAGAPIGSLYRFFPNKNAVADALMRSYSELIDTSFEKIDTRPEAMSLDEFADTLLDSMSEMRSDVKAAIMALLDVHPDADARRDEFHAMYLRHIARVLKERDPRLTARKAGDMAVVLLQNMRCLKTLSAERNTGALAELRTMTRLYIKSKLG